MLRLHVAQSAAAASVAAAAAAAAVAAAAAAAAAANGNLRPAHVPQARLLLTVRPERHPVPFGKRSQLCRTVHGDILDKQ